MSMYQEYAVNRSLRYNALCTNSMQQARGLGTLDIDLVAGKAYATSAEDNPLRVVQFQLAHGNLSLVTGYITTYALILLIMYKFIKILNHFLFRLLRNEDRARASYIDTENNYLIITTTSGSVVRVKYPDDCLANCYFRGNCSFGICECEDEWTGVDCNTRTFISSQN